MAVVGFTLDQGPPNFSVRGPRKVMQNMSRARRLTQCDCCGTCHILQNQQSFRKYTVYYFFIIDKMDLRAGWNGSAGRIWPVGRSFETPALDLWKLLIVMGCCCFSQMASVLFYSHECMWGSVVCDSSPAGVRMSESWSCDFVNNDWSGCMLQSLCIKFLVCQRAL